jgi:hypothetical protein
MKLVLMAAITWLYYLIVKLMFAVAHLHVSLTMSALDYGYAAIAVAAWAFSMGVLMSDD